MARAEVKLYKQKTGKRERQLVCETIIQEDNLRTTIPWIRSVIHRYFEEFVITENLILLSRTKRGYAAMRSCLPTAPDFFAWMFLEIVPLKEESLFTRPAMAPSGIFL